MRKAIMLAAVGCAMAWTGTSRAAGDEEFGKQGQFILSADRLMPFFAYTNERTTLEQNNQKDTVSTSNASMGILFGRSTNANIPYTIPRVGFDYTIIDHLTLGGNIIAIFGFGGSVTGTRETPGQTVTTTSDSPTITGFGIAPRVGYIFDLSSVFYIWLRGGFSFYTLSAKSTDRNNPNNVTTDSRSVFGLDLEPTLVISPINHFGITIGLPVDIGFAGSQKHEEQNGATTRTTDLGYSAFHFGINAGLLGYF
jgi:hypothetical protein